VAVARRLRAIVCTRLRRRYDAIAAELGGDAPLGERPARVPSALAAVTDEDRQHAGRLPFFAHCSRGDLRRLLSEARRMDVARGDELVRCGDQPLLFYLTLRGAVEAVVARRHLKQRVRLAGPGSACAYAGIIDDGAAPLDCRARERAVLLAFPRAVVHELLEADDPIARRFAEALDRDLVSALHDAERRQATLVSAGGSLSGASTPR
jgi:CRP-like cAMP-binding protein